MASFGGSGGPAATQTQAVSPFAANPFTSKPNPSPFSSNPFSAPNTNAQGNGAPAARNPFAAVTSSTPGTQPNPFTTATTFGAPSGNGPFKAKDTAQQNFPKKDAGTFGAPSLAQANPSQSAFSMPSNQGQTNPFLKGQAKPFSPSTSKLNNGPTPSTFGAPSAFTPNGGRTPKFGAPSTSKPNAAPKPAFGAPSAFSKGSQATTDVNGPPGDDSASDTNRSKRTKRGQAVNQSGFETKKNGPGQGNPFDRSKRNGSPFSGTNDNKVAPKGPRANGNTGLGKRVHFNQQPSGPSKPPGTQFNQSTFGQRNMPPSALKGSKTRGMQPANTNDPYAKKILDQLSRDGVHPPKWPAEPGNPANKNVMMTFRESYKEYRDKARASLVRAGLIDDPEDRKRLEDAIDFKGICEDMCPEFEKVTRITEYDVKQAEKHPGNQWPDTSRMVKKLARSAAGQEAPLPMDVRSIRTLRRTLDYLIDDLLQADDNLPVVHGFLWDRTRAIRRDFAFFSTMSADEMRHQVHCLETIARFHVTSLHLLCQQGFTPEDFSEQQEVEQLGKTLISLMYAYNDCNAQGVVCENEAEFRAYQLLFRASHPDVLEIVQREWDAKLWRDSDDIRTAVSLVEALQNTQDFHGPLKGGPSLAASSAYNTYFRIVEDPSTSYTMACFAEIHFGQLRRSMLSSLKKAFSRPKQTPKDVTAAVLNSYLRFDTVQEAIDFAENHGLEVVPDDDEPDNIEKSYLVLEYGSGMEYPRLHHSFSASLVEKKRGAHSLPEVIHQTVFDGSISPTTGMEPEEEDSLFVPEVARPKEVQKPVQFAPVDESPMPSPPTVGFGGMSALMQQQQPTLGTTPGIPPNKAPVPTTAFAGQPSGTAATPTGSSASPFAKPSVAIGAGSGQATPFPQANSTGQPAPPAPPPSFSVKPTQPAAPTTGTTTKPNALQSTPAPPSVTNDKAPSFSFLGALSKKPETTASPEINVIPPTPAAPPKSPFTASPTASASSAAPAVPPTTQPSPFGLPPDQVQNQPSISQTTPATTGTSAASPAPAPTSFTPHPPKTAPPPVSRPPTKDEKWDGFTKWFVMADNGLMSEFETFMIEEAVRKVYDQFVREEEERVRKEEDEKSWAEARKFRKYNLRVKFFYRWREAARRNRASTLRRSGRDQVRAYQEARRAEKLAEKKKAERERRRILGEDRRASLPVDNVKDLKAVMAREKRKRPLSVSEAEDALLASGVLSGVRNEKEAVAMIVRGGDMSPPPPPSFRKKPGLPAFMSRIATGLGQSVSRSIEKMKPNNNNGGGAKTRALREEFSDNPLRRSLARSSSRASVSSVGSEDGGSLARVSTRWRLKAMGFVTMPDGSVLPESLAHSMIRDGKRYPELGNFGLPPSSSGFDGTVARRASATDLELRPATMDGSEPQPQAWKSQSLHRSRASVSGPNGVVDLTHKRKRTPDDVGEAEGGEEGGQSDASSSKRILLDTERTIREMRRLREEMEEGKGWYKEQNVRLQSELSGSRPGTPW